MIAVDRLMEADFENVSRRIVQFLKPISMALLLYPHLNGFAKIRTNAVDVTGNF